MDIRYLPNILGENSPGPLQYPFSNCYGSYSSSSRPMTLRYGAFGANLGTYQVIPCKYFVYSWSWLLTILLSQLFG
jgi:hypothetical protein